MPVIATPLSTVISTATCPVDNTGVVGPTNTPPTSLTSCIGQRVVVANSPVEAAKGTLVPGRIRTVAFNGGRDVTVQWTMLDSVGNPVDMTACNCTSVVFPAVCPYSFELHFCEYWGCEPIKTVAATLDPLTGVISANVPQALTNTAGMYWAEVVMYETIGAGPKTAVFTNQFYMVINRDLLQAGNPTLAGPPSIAEIRLFMRDSGKVESYLLDSYRFDPSEISLAIVLPVQMWNETPPFGVSWQTTATFPFRYNWLQAITGHLMLMVAEQQRANHLPYSSAGVNVDDNAKSPEYTAEGRYRIENYKKWVQQMKVSLNMRQCYGSSSSPYARGSY